MNLIVAILLICAIVCFCLAAFGLPKFCRAECLGFAFLTAVLLLPHLS